MHAGVQDQHVASLPLHAGGTSRAQTQAELEAAVPHFESFIFAWALWRNTIVRIWDVAHYVIPHPPRPRPEIQRCDFRNLATAYGRIHCWKIQSLIKNKVIKDSSKGFSLVGTFSGEWQTHRNKSSVVLPTRPSPTKSCYWKNCLG